MKVSQQVTHKDFKKGDLVRLIYRINGYLHDQVVEIKEIRKKTVIFEPAGLERNMEIDYDKIINFEKPKK